MAPTICTEDEARVRSSIRDSRKRLQSSSNSLSSSVINYVGRSTHKQTGSVRNGAKVNRVLSQMSDDVIAATATATTRSEAASVKDPPSVLSIPATTATAVLPGARGRDESDVQDDLYSVSSNNSKDVNEVQYDFHDDEEDSIMTEMNDGSDMEDCADNHCTDLKSLGAPRRTGNYIHKQRHPHKIIKAKYKRLQAKGDSPSRVIDPLESARYYGDSVIVRLDHNPVGHDDNSIASTFSTSSSLMEDEITSPYTPTPCLSLPVKSNNTKGLLDIAVKTVKLIKRNQMLQKKLAQLQFETKAFIESVLSNPENQAIREKIQSGRAKQIEA